MTRTIHALLLIVLAVAAPGRAGVAASDIPAAVVAVLDYQAIVRNSKAGQKVRERIEAYRSEFHQEITERENRLKEQEGELQRQQSILSPEAFEDKRRKFEQDVIDMQRAAQDRNHQLERTHNVAFAKIHEAIVPIVQRLTKELGFNVVVDKTQVLIARRQLDITDRVLQDLDAALPQVAVPKPGK